MKYILDEKELETIKSDEYTRGRKAGRKAVATLTCDCLNGRVEYETLRCSLDAERHETELYEALKHYCKEQP